MFQALPTVLMVISAMVMEMDAFLIQITVLLDILVMEFKLDKELFAFQALTTVQLEILMMDLDINASLVPVIALQVGSMMEQGKNV